MENRQRGDLPLNDGDDPEETSRLQWNKDGWWDVEEEEGAEGDRIVILEFEFGFDKRSLC